MLTEESAENWIPLPQLQRIGWNKLYSDLKQTGQQLIEFLKSKEDSFLDAQLSETEYNNEYFVAGLLHHDVYHLGQIGLILKWAKQ